jgi:hypothetical protein
MIKLAAQKAKVKAKKRKDGGGTEVGGARRVAFAM